MRALTKKNFIILGSVILTFAIIQVLLSFKILSSFYEITLATICINIILAVSLNLVTGFTGQFSLGHAGFMSIGAYVCALVNMEMKSTAGFLIGLASAGLDHRLQRLFSQRRTSDQFIELVDIALMVLAVVETDGLRRDIGVQRIFRIR